MNSSVLNFYSEKTGEISKFLEAYFAQKFENIDDLFWKQDFENPIEMIDIITCFIDNNDKYNMNLWISLDKNIYICITEKNINDIVKYIYERYPW